LANYHKRFIVASHKRSDIDDPTGAFCAEPEAAPAEKFDSQTVV